jgi:hypothetical protein
MIALAKRATPAAIAVLRQATALWPKRKKASDGLLPSRAHVKQNPNSDHNSGFCCRSYPRSQKMVSTAK